MQHVLRQNGACTNKFHLTEFSAGTLFPSATEHGIEKKKKKEKGHIFFLQKVSRLTFIQPNQHHCAATHTPPSRRPYISRFRQQGEIL